MCPEQQLISIYLDGELPSPWKEKMQRHFSQCPACKDKLEKFEKLHRIFISEDMPSQAKDRVWEKIETRQSSVASQSRLTSRGGDASNSGYSLNSYKPRVWQRRISIPLPAAAAAAVIIILLAVFWLRMEAPIQGDDRTNFILASEFEEMPGIIPAADMSGVFQYLPPSNNGANIIILQLPDNQSFFRAGEPEIVRAANFTRR